MKNYYCYKGGEKHNYIAIYDCNIEKISSCAQTTDQKIFLFMICTFCGKKILKDEEK